MRLLWFVFVYLIAISNASSVKRACQNLAPGLVTMTYGVDITFLDQFPVEGFSDDGSRQSIFEFTCHLNLNWTDPFDQTNYSVPDQVAHYSVKSSADLNEQISVSSNLQNTKESLGGNLKVKFGAGKKSFGSLSLSGAFQSAQKEIIKENQSIATASIKVTFSTVQFIDGEEMKVNNKFSKFINRKLVHKYEDDPEVYESFLDTFGTHYYEQANFGGYLYQKTTIRNSYLFKEDSLNIKGKLKGKLKEHIKGEGQLGYNNTQVEEEFESNVESKFKFFGGWTDGSELKDKKEWLESVRKSPWLYYGRLVPIENLIQNQTTKEQVTKASTIRRIDAYYQELKQVLLLSNVQLSVNDSKSLERIEKVLSLPPKQRNSMDTSSFLEIGESIEMLLVSVQIIRDRAMLKEYQEKLTSCYEKISQCNSFYCSLELKEKDNYKQLKEKMEKQSTVGHKMESQKVQDLVEQASKMRSKWAAKVEGC